MDEKEVLALDGANTLIILDVDDGIDELTISLSLLLFFTQALIGVTTVTCR